jgi:hypothetical protein
VRCGKAQAKRELAAGHKRLPELLDHTHCQSATVWELLRATPTVGAVKARRMLDIVRVPAGKRVHTLTDRQRDMLAHLVAGQERLPSYPRQAG